MLPASYDFSIVRGTSGPLQGLTVQLKNDNAGTLENMLYEDVRLSIYKRSTLINRFSLSNGTLIESDPDEAQISWNPTSEQTRLIPLGPKCTYELEVWYGGTEVVYMSGTITGVGGLNDDEDVS